MFIILEHNGSYPNGIMMSENGENEVFETEEEAEKFAKENCAFEYKIIEL